MTKETFAGSEGFDQAQDIALASGEVERKIGSFTAHSEKGSRPYQEDRLVTETLTINGRQLQVLAVMDGHSGVFAAEKVGDSLTTAIQQASESENSISSLLDKAVNRLVILTDGLFSGTTLSVVIVPENKRKAYVAILGDSPVIISDKDGNINISPEHNARTNTTERQAAINRGAGFDGDYLYNKDTYEGLQMSRALGDYALRGFLSRQPEIYTVDLNKDSFILVATDGVFDPSHYDAEQEIERLTKMVAEGADATAVIKDAVERETGDNATAIVWRAA